MVCARSAFAFGTNAPISRFSCTVISGKTCRPSGTWAMPSSGMRYGGSVLRSVPAKVTLPVDSFTRPEIARSVVLLPAPLAPSRPTASPALMLMETWEIAGTEPYAALMPLSSSMGASARWRMYMGPEIGADDLRIFHDLLGRAFRDLLAMVEHDDMPRHRHDRAHQVFDDDDGEPPLRQLADQRDRLVDLGRIEPGHHLVQQQDARLRGERARHLQPALVDGGQILGRRSLARGQADEVDDLAGPLARGGDMAVAQEGAGHDIG